MLTYHKVFHQFNKIYAIILLSLISGLLLAGCGKLSVAEQAEATAVAQSTLSLQETKIAALTAVVATKTAEAMPTPTPPPPYVCVGRGDEAGMTAVLDPFGVSYDEAVTYEMCELEDQGETFVCTKKTALEKGQYGPIIPDARAWIIIPKVDEAVCDDGNGRWVLVVAAP